MHCCPPGTAPFLRDCYCLQQKGFWVIVLRLVFQMTIRWNTFGGSLCVSPWNARVHPAFDWLAWDSLCDTSGDDSRAHTHTHTLTHIHAHTLIHTHSSIYTHKHTSTHTNTCTYTHTTHMATQMGNLENVINLTLMEGGGFYQQGEWRRPLQTQSKHTHRGHMIVKVESESRRWVLSAPARCILPNCC